MSFEIEGKVALVTGGASGIGFYCIKELLKHEAKGIAFIDTNAEKGQSALDEITKEFGDNRCIFIKGDITELERFEEAFELTIKTFKQLDIVINNAGIFNEKNWLKCMDVNLISCIIGTKLALEKYLVRHKVSDEGVILNMSSIYGLTGNPLCPVYSATKHGIIGLSKSYGAKQHYRKTNVKVIAMCPGLTRTPIFEVTPDQLLIEHHENEDTNECKILQKVEHVAENVVKVIREGISGSVWVVKNGEPAYEE